MPKCFTCANAIYDEVFGEYKCDADKITVRDILKAMNHNDTLDCLLIGVDEQYKSKGVTSLIFDALSKPIKEYGIKYIESTRELEDNTSVQNLWNRFEYRLHKRARCYIKSI